ncbi:MAG: hypothetical protein PHC61_13905 [Chitinivibrionales bacterium]|nr:hypothetical protein [Chitinivibrionales bacterium]
MIKKYLLITFGVVLVFSVSIFATQRTAVLLTVKDHGYMADSSTYFIKTVESLGGNLGNTLYWSTSTYAGKSAICALGFFLNRGTKIRLNYNDSTQSQNLVQILDPIQ